jgi:hypothetical protein
MACTIDNSLRISTQKSPDKMFCRRRFDSHRPSFCRSLLLSDLFPSRSIRDDLRREYHVTTAAPSSGDVIGVSGGSPSDAIVDPVDTVRFFCPH